MDVKQLPHEFHTSFRSKEDAVEKLQRIRDEQRRTQKELANPNADLRYGKARTYERRSTAEGRRRSLDKFRVMQRPKLRTEVSAAAAELERHRGCERRKMKKEEGPAMPIYK